MKWYILLPFFVLFFSSLHNTHAQWEPEVRLTNDSAHNFLNLYSIKNCIAASGDTLHLVWWDNGDGISYEIYYMRSTDKGLTWNTDTMLSAVANFSSLPSITVNGSNIYIVWIDERDGNLEIYFKSSSDGGNTWGFDKRLSNSTNDSMNPSMAVSGSNVHVLFYDETPPKGNNIIYRRSTDGGNFWDTYTTLTSNNTTITNISVVASGQVLHLTWHDQRDGSNGIFYRRSTDDGTSWSQDRRLTLSGYLPSIVISGSVVNIFWTDERDGNQEIYHKRSTDSGLNWEPDIRLTNDTIASVYPLAVSSGSTLHLVWANYHNSGSKNEFIYKRSTDDGMTWGNEEILINDHYRIDISFSIAAIDSSVYFVWIDYRDTVFGEHKGEIYFRRNITGKPTDIKNIELNRPAKYELFQNYPNPFNPSTVIQYSIPEEEFVTIKIFNLLGEEINTLISENISKGTHRFEWTPENISSGLYLYQMQAGTFIQTKKLIFLR